MGQSLANAQASYLVGDKELLTGLKQERNTGRCGFLKNQASRDKGTF